MQYKDHKSLKLKMVIYSVLFITHSHNHGEDCWFGSCAEDTCWQHSQEGEATIIFKQLLHPGSKAQKTTKMVIFTERVTGLHPWNAPLSCPQYDKMRETHRPIFAEISPHFNTLSETFKKLIILGDWAKLKRMSRNTNLINLFLQYFGTSGILWLISENAEGHHWEPGCNLKRYPQATSIRQKSNFFFLTQQNKILQNNSL